VKAMSRIDITRRRLLSALAVVPAALACGIVPSRAADIVLSFVHPHGRVDVPAGAVRRIRAFATRAFVIKETRQRLEFPETGVEFCLSKGVRIKLLQLTERIVDQPLDLVIGCDVIASPIVREPIGGSPGVQLTTFGLAEAQSIADRLAGGGTMDCPASRVSAPTA
jgi:hypothetical protein